MAQDEFLEDDIDDQKTVEYIRNTLPQELKEKSFETAGALERAGLLVCIVTDAPVIPLNHLALCAGLAPIPSFLLDKHYLRKHGANAYYGQKTAKE